MTSMDECQDWEFAELNDETFGSPKCGIGYSEKGRLFYVQGI